MTATTTDETATLRALLAQRWAALATSRDGEPLASWVAVVRGPEPATWLLHLSRLALHTRYIEIDPRASLAFSEPDGEPARDPQTLARVSVQGRMTAIGRDHDGYRAARERYLRALPQADVQFTLADFRMWRFVPDHARFVPGFGRAHRLDRTGLVDLLASGWPE